MTRPTDIHLRLGDACRGLLGYDGQLVAVSIGGVIELADPSTAKSICRLQTQGPVTVEPCISDGILYVGTRGQVSAYALAPMTMAAPRVKPLWHVPLNGTPIQALTPVGDRLYVTVATADWREVHVIENLRGVRPTVSVLQGGRQMSWMAADPAASRAVFLTETDGRMQLHVAGRDVVSHSVNLRTIVDHPIAYLDGSVFAILGDEHRLYRLDASTGAVEEPLDDDTQFFAVTHDADGEWDRDSVQIDTNGVLFSRTGVRDSFEPHDRPVKGSPLIVQGCAAVVGMEDGRIRIYDLAHLPRHEVWRVGDSTAPVTALASFDSYIAAGNKEGSVEVRELRAKGADR